MDIHLEVINTFQKLSNSVNSPTNNFEICTVMDTKVGTVREVHNNLDLFELPFFY